MPENLTWADRFAGCLLGLAVGDALGSHYEGQTTDWIRERFSSPEALIQNLPQSPWHYTDDTQMTIGVAEALLQDGEIVEETLCAAFVENYAPSRGYGRGARFVLDAMKDGTDYKHWARELFPGGSFGNGAAMRVAPVGLMFHDDADQLWQQAEFASLPTHIHPLGVEGAQLIARAVAICLNSDSAGHAAGTSGLDKSTFLADLQGRVKTADFQEKLKLAEKVESASDLISLGNGIAAHESVVTAIACFLLWPDCYQNVVCNAILLGGDTDTIAAMAGAISGAYLGVQAIPPAFLSSLEDDHKGRSYILDLARQLSAKKA